MPHRPPTADQQEIDDALSIAYEERVRDLAGAHLEDAIETHAELAGNRAVAPSIRQRSAQALIEHGHSRAKPKPGMGTSVGSLTVNLISFDGEGEGRGSPQKVVDVGAHLDRIAEQASGDDDHGSS